MNMGEIGEFFGKMRKPRAIGGSYLVYGAHIRLEVEKLAGFRLIHPVAITPSFFPQPFLLKLIHAHIEMRGDAFQVFGRVGWCHRPAAIGAGKTIRFPPHFLFQYGDLFVQRFGRILFQFGQVSAHTAAGMTGFLTEGTEINGY